MCLEDNVVCHGGPMPIFRNFTLRVVSLNVPVGKGLEPMTTLRQLTAEDFFPHVHATAVD